MHPSMTTPKEQVCIRHVFLVVEHKLPYPSLTASASVRPNFSRHDLSALRELRTEPAVWRALVDTLVLRYPDETAPGPTEEAHAPHEANTALAVPSAAAPTNQGQLAGPDAPPSTQGARRSRSSSDARSAAAAAMLCFRHERRLTLATSCLLMGRAVPVSVFEENRSDFWCEAEVPAALTSTGRAACRVGMRLPKECIPLILDEDHPMRMRTILDASDLRHLSVLIADRLKLCRVGSTRKGLPRSYRYWLDGAIGGASRAGSSEGSARAAAAMAAAAGSADAKQRDDAESGQEFKLSLRKRSTGQVAFSRLVSFWVPSITAPEANECGRRGLSPPPGRHVIQKLVVVKEFAHRGECGELRGEVHDPSPGGEIDTFVPARELTYTLLRDRLAEMRADDRSKNPCARYWRDALTWRLRIASEPTLSCDGIDAGKENETNALGGMKGIPVSSPTNRGDWVPRLTVDERKPLVTLRGVAVASLETPGRGEGEGSDGPLTASKTYFDAMLLLRCPEPGSSTDPARKQTPAIELVATHRQTMTAFSFPVSAAALVKELDAMVASCLTAPTALSTELELSTSNTVLGRLAGHWLQYFPCNAQGGRGPTLTLNLPRSRTEPVVAEPYVSLRYAENKRAPYGTRRLAEAKGAPIAAGVGPTTSMARRAPSSREKSRAARGSTPGGRPRSARKSIVTLKVETRNERMVFRRSLPVPRWGDLVGPGRRDEEVKGLEPKVLAVSVYEAFTVGSTGRIERHLRFCARDESIRPVVEASAAVPWVGTCEGIEGGKLWRVVAQGLSVERARDNMGKCVGMRLKVATEDESEERVVSHHAEQPVRRESIPLTTLLSIKAEGEKNGGRHGTDDSSEPSAAAVVVRGSEKKFGVEHSVIIERERASSGRASDKTGDANSCHHLRDDAQAADAAVAVDPRKQQVCLVWARTDQTTKVYSGWHRVTGIRLHVQCFQHSNGSAGGHGGNATRTTPAARGGVIGLPRDASLQFLLCDPSTGQRTGVRVSVDDICRNLSIEGGIVEAGLLDAGRRPAMAKAIAEKLRLVFDADGGYRVVLPLPAEWCRACRKAG